MPRLRVLLCSTNDDSMTWEYRSRALVHDQCRLGDLCQRRYSQSEL